MERLTIRLYRLLCIKALSFHVTNMVLACGYDKFTTGTRYIYVRFGRMEASILSDKVGRTWALCLPPPLLVPPEDTLLTHVLLTERHRQTCKRVAVAYPVSYLVLISDLMPKIVRCNRSVCFVGLIGSMLVSNVKVESADSQGAYNGFQFRRPEPPRSIVDRRSYCYCFLYRLLSLRIRISANIRMAGGLQSTMQVIH